MCTCVYTERGGGGREKEGDRRDEELEGAEGGNDGLGIYLCVSI